MKPNDVAIRKRTQIAKANKTMFLWIAIASALVGSALVVSFFLWQKVVFNEKVLSAKQDTVNALNTNNEVAPELEDEIRVLDTNQALISSKANDNDQAIQVILDALPSDGNSLALGASLQNKLLAGVPGITSIQSLRVDPIAGLEALSDDTSVVDASATTTGNEITFQLSIKGSQEGIKTVLQNFEKSIRLIKVTSMQIETQQDGQLMTLQAKAFYEPSKSIELTDKVINP
jgi:hypothetical protein